MPDLTARVERLSPFSFVPRHTLIRIPDSGLTIPTIGYILSPSAPPRPTGKRHGPHGKDRDTPADGDCRRLHGDPGAADGDGMSAEFRRDANLALPEGLLIGEFANAHDALHFARSKGERYTVTAGINLPYAVRVKAPTLVMMACTEHGRERMPALQKMLDNLLRTQS